MKSVRSGLPKLVSVAGIPAAREVHPDPTRSFLGRSAASRFLSAGPPVDQIALSAAARFVLRSAYGLEVGATVPVAGRERSLATVDLRATWRH